MDLSIIIPIGPDDNAWQTLLPELLACDKEVEIILSACQDQPENTLLQDARVQWLSGQQGRAHQLNAGARVAKGKLLWFLHADSHLSEEVWPQIAEFWQQNTDALAYFELSFTSDGPWLTRFNAQLANLRARYLGLPFGDQGFVLKKSLFNALNGFDTRLKRGEDLDFVVRARHAGYALMPLAAVLQSSARRYQTQGWLKTSLEHIFLTLLMIWQAKRRVKHS